MRTVRNITIAVDPELYRQTRCLAAEYNTSITGMVRYLLGVLPEALKAARVPGGRPQFGIAAARARAAAAALAAKQPAPQISIQPDICTVSSTDASSLRITWLTAGCVLCSRTAAREKLRSSATAKNVSS